MQARSREVCGKALDVFLRLDPAAVDWEILVDASPEAQIEALIRVDTLNDRVLARHVLRKLIARLQPKAARRMAEQAQSLGVRLGIDDRSIFEQWHALESDSDRTSLLTALSGFDLGDLVYTHDFRVVMDDAASEGEDSSVREAALRLIMRQVALECGRSPSCARSASFPVLVSRSRQNAMLKGLSLAAAFGAADVRREAFKLMVRKGFAEEGSRAFAALAESADQSKELEALTGLPEISRCDSTIALLGRLLTPDHQELARRIVDHLSLVASQTPPDQRWRLFAALKAGADIPAMDELASQLSPPASDAVLVWLHSICHMSSQDRQRLASMAMPEDRLERLTEINLRRGRLIDGEYAALAIIETTLPRERAQSVTSFAGEKVRWQAPVHQTVLMPRLTLKAIDQTEAATGDELREDEYRAFWKDKSIGRGYIVAASQTIRRPDSYCPSLICGTDAWFEPGSTAGETQSDESRVAVGPLELPSRRPANAPASGTMTLDVSDWLRAGLSEAGAFAPSKANRLVPKPLEITLRYGAFGSYYGTTMRIKPPEERPPEGLPHLTNVMIVLERIDLPPENASASRP